MTNDDKLSKIRNLIDIQKDLYGKDGYKGCQDDTLKEYHRGMANGLIIAESVLSGDECAFVDYK
jgi:hypothetical protein